MKVCFCVPHDNKWISKIEIQAFTCVPKIISFTVLNTEICVLYLMKTQPTVRSTIPKALGLV